MSAMQEFIDFIFEEVWCKSPDTHYGIHLFEGNDYLLSVMEELFKRDLAGKFDKEEGAAWFFYLGVNEIYVEFKNLTADVIEEYRERFVANNRIEELCLGDNGVVPVKYKSLDPAYVQLNKKIEGFFSKLYSSGFFDLKFVKDIIGETLGGYYKALVRENDECVCSFCGLLPIDSEFDPTRNAFDHYLPKSIYPFNSVNLKNLAPACDSCNSGNKRDKDPLHDELDNRRRAFYPFSTNPPDIAITISFEDANWDSLKPEMLTVDIGSTNFIGETDTWKKLFNIEQRYVAKCCNKTGGSKWLKRIIDECQNYKLSREDMLEAELVTAANSPWSDANFLKIAFLEGCDATGVFETS